MWKPSAWPPFRRHISHPVATFSSFTTTMVAPHSTSAYPIPIAILRGRSMDSPPSPTSTKVGHSISIARVSPTDGPSTTAATPRPQLIPAPNGDSQGTSSGDLPVYWAIRTTNAPLRPPWNGGEAFSKAFKGWRLVLIGSCKVGSTVPLSYSDHYIGLNVLLLFIPASVRNILGLI